MVLQCFYEYSNRSLCLDAANSSAFSSPPTASTKDGSDLHICNWRIVSPSQPSLGGLPCYAEGPRLTIYSACVTSMVRLNYLTRATHTTDPTSEYTNLPLGGRATSLPLYADDNGPIAVWPQIELNMGIICSCLPPLQPLVTRVFPGLLGSVTHSRGRANYYGGYPNFGFNGHDSGPHSSVSASRSKERAHCMDAITITQELHLESSDHQYAATVKLTAKGLWCCRI